jgi:hypothetical protein
MTEYCKGGYGSKRAVLPVMMITKVKVKKAKLSL